MPHVLESRCVWRRIYTYGATLLNSAGVIGVVLRINDPNALKWIALALIGANVAMTTFYLAGATVTDWAKLAAAARGGAAKL